MDHPYSLVIACWGLFYVHAARRELSHAVQLGERALAMARERELPLGVVGSMGFLGYAYALSGRIADGLALLEESIRRHESFGIVYCHSLTVAHLAEAHLLAGRLDDALVFGERALRLARERGERGFEAWGLRALGEIAAQPDPPDVVRAEGRYREALALAEELRMRPLVAHCHLGLGELHRRTGDHARVEEHLAAATAMYREMGMNFWLEKAEAALGSPPRNPR